MFRCIIAIVGTVVHQMIGCVSRTIFSGVIIRIISDSYNINRILIVFAFWRIIGLSAMLWQIFSLECLKIDSDTFCSQFPGLPLDCFCNFFPPPCSVFISSLLKQWKTITDKTTYFSLARISSGGIGSPEHVCGWALWAGRPGPFFVCSLFRTFALKENVRWVITYVVFFLLIKKSDTREK